MNGYIDLNEFTDPWGMPPSDAPIYMAPLYLATNGHIGIAAYEESVASGVEVMREAETDNGKTPWDSHAAKISSVLDASHSGPKTPWGKLPAFEVPTKDAKCLECDGNGRLAECGKCQGDGVIECPCCHAETGCKTCIGSGYMPDTDGTGEACGRCRGFGVVYSSTEKERAVKVQGVHFDAHYLALIKDFPGLEVAVGSLDEGKGGALAFSWAHGVGVLMELCVSEGRRDRYGNVERTG